MTGELIAWGIIGFLAQLIDASLGMGYGVFSTTLVVGAGVAPALASASVHTAEVVTTLFSGGSHLIFGNVRREWLFRLVIPGIAGGAAGAWVLSSFPGDTMRPLVSIFLLLLGLLIVVQFARRRVVSPENRLPPVGGEYSTRTGSFARISLLGLVAAFFDAVGGGGWGPITTPGLILGENAEVCKAVGTVNAAEFFITIAISITFLVRMGWNLFDWKLVGALITGGIIAAPIGAYLCKRLPARLLGISIGLVIVATNLRTILIALF